MCVAKSGLAVDDTKLCGCAGETRIEADYL